MNEKQMKALFDFFINFSSLIQVLFHLVQKGILLRYKGLKIPIPMQSQQISSGLLVLFSARVHSGDDVPGYQLPHLGVLWSW